MNSNDDKEPKPPEPTRCRSLYDDQALMQISNMIGAQRRAARRPATPAKIEEPKDDFTELDADLFDELPDIDGALMEEIIETEIRVWNENRKNR